MSRVSAERPKRDVPFVVARATNGCIAASGDVPWKIREDLKRFKAHTLGNPIVMGRKTFDSLPGLLPGRRHIVITRNRHWHAPGAEVVHDEAGVLALVGEDDFSVIGGAEIFAMLDHLATRWEITEVHEDTPGDVFMPLPDPSQWEEAAREPHEAADGWPAYDFVTYRRRDR
ncbi:MAG: dihydrofolate reductase [Pseudomonadota bacterium]